MSRFMLHVVSTLLASNKTHKKTHWTFAMKGIVPKDS